MEGVGKSFFLVIHNTFNEALRSHKVFIVPAHEFNDLGANGTQEGILQVKDLAEADGPSNDASQDITPPFI